jgi:chromosome segregation protein
MVFVSEVRLKHFKSFHKADVKLASGVTALVGPNGSGKSNIVDSLCFAFGETSMKAMRARRISDLVSAKADMAEVSVLLENGSERYEIRRMIKRDGKTAYKLNGKNITRTSVLDTLAPVNMSVGTHNVIMQGEAERIVKMGATERRQIIDRVAGIADYEEKKKEAQAELATVDQNLNNVRIVLAEREGFLSALEAERNNALRYNELRATLRQGKASLIFTELKRVDAEHTKVAKRGIEAKAEAEALEKGVAGIDARMKELEAAKELVNREFLEKGEGEQVTLHRTIEETKAGIELCRSKKRDRESLLEGVKQNVAALDAERAAMDAKVAACKSEAEAAQKHRRSIEEKLALYEKEHGNVLAEAEQVDKGFYEAKTKQGQMEAELDAKKEKFFALKSEIGRLRDVKKMREKEIERIAAERPAFLAGFDDKKDALAAEAEKLKSEQDEVAYQLESLFTEEKLLNQKLSETESRLMEAKEQFVTLSAKLQGARPSDDAAAREVLQLKKIGVLPGVCGLVAELCRFSTEHSVAAEAAAGGRLNFVVVEDVDTAAEAIEHLKRRKLGRATFIPLDKIKRGAITEQDRQLAKKQGAVGFLLELVEYDAKYANAFSFVFGNTLVVDGIEAAKGIGVGRIRMVTLSGELFEASGAITGGAMLKPKLLLMKEKADAERLGKEVEALKAERDGVLNSLYTIREEMSRKRARRAELEVKAKSAELELADLQERYRETELQRRGAEKALAAMRDDAEKAEKDAAAKEAELQQTEHEVRTTERFIAEIKRKTDAGGTDYKERLRAVEKELESLRAKKAADDAKTASLDSQLDVFGKRLFDIEAERKRVKAEIANAESAIKELEKEAEALSKKLAEKSERMSRISSSMSELMSRRTKLEAEMAKAGQERGKAGYSLEKLARELGALEVQKAALDTRLADLKAELASYNDVVPSEGDKAALEETIRSAEREIESLGAVNLKAPEMYEQKKAEVEGIRHKVDTLTDERKAISRMIDEVEAKKTAVFMQTLGELDANFRKLFVRVFGGDAGLVLENPEAPFAGGLQIRVRPEKKEIRHLESMSGGEKSLVALMFVFAIQMHKPAPLYVLDEADAALDKENSGKLAELLKAMSGNTQFIVVTHNEQMITRADTVIGVTMTKEGSRLVGVELRNKAS